MTIPPDRSTIRDKCPRAQTSLAEIVVVGDETADDLLLASLPFRAC